MSELSQHIGTEQRPVKVEFGVDSAALSNLKNASGFVKAEQVEGEAQDLEKLEKFLQGVQQPTGHQRPPTGSREQKSVKTTPRRFTTPTPDAAASLPTPLPQSPPAESAPSGSRAVAPLPQTYLNPQSTPGGSGYGLVTPVTPIASTSQLPFAGHETPRHSRSATKASRLPIPLSSLIPAGTILLRHHQVSTEALKAEDGWSALAKGVLEQLHLPEVLEDATVAEVTEADSEPIAPAKSKSKGKGKGKRKASTSLGGSPVKKARVIPTPEALLEVLLHLQDALILRATFTAVADRILLRIYLIPSDTPELSLDDHTVGKRASPADSTLLRALREVRLSRAEWDGTVEEESVSALMEEKDQRSILELYRAVESPPLDPFSVDHSLEAASDVVKDRIAQAIETGPAGLITEMYPYQKASLGKMLQRELAPQWTIDPSYLLRKSPINGSSFYISCRGNDVVKEPPRILEPKSGILAEDMGSGKTLISIALVLSTLGELPSLQGTPTYLDDSSPSPEPVLMTHRSRMFPFKTEMDEERSLRPRVPPPLLDPKDMDAAELEMYQRLLARQAAEDARQVVPDLPSLRNLLIDYLRTSPTAIPYSPSDPRLLGTGLTEELGDTNPYYNLRPSPLQLLSRAGRTGLSAASQIVVNCATLIVVPTGLVRQWEDELKKHVKAGQMRILVQRTKKDGFITPQQLAGYDLILMSIARFSDAADDPSSSLRRAHFKRLVVDEGHCLSSDNRMRRLAEEIRVECRWAISGTPTRSLRSQAAENEGALFAQDATAGGNEDDYSRLAELYSRFLRHPSFPKADKFRQLFTDPIIKHGRGSERLARLFNNSIIRNSPERLKEAYTLPPLTREVVSVELGETERKTYNALVAIFKINSVLTQRVDQDFFFHPKNKKYLDELTDNLSASSSFYASVGFHASVIGAVKNAEETLNSEKSLKWTAEDRQSLRKAIEVIREALKDEQWKAIISSVGVNLEVENLDSGLVKVFGGLKQKGDASLVPLHQLVTLRVDLKELQKPDFGAWKDDEDLREELITFEQKRQRLEAMPLNSKARAELEEPKVVKMKRKKGQVQVLKPLPANSIFHRIQLGATSSAKINYIIDDARKHPDEKIIVFSSSLPDLVFAQLSEAMDLVGIRHAIFAGASSAKGRDRGSIAARFNTTSAKECQVILVDARLGGRGFCLTAASRVVMMEPIWQKDLEVQAAKRAHRLGQTKPVSLVVLVVPGSYEDHLLQRRAEVEPTSQTKQPQRDSKLANVLQSAGYLEPAKKAPIDLQRVPLIKDDLIDPSAGLVDPPPPPAALPPLHNLPSSSTSSLKKSEDSDYLPPTKKVKKTVQFA